MISHPTVLILGAGASYPYGFPLGRELLSEIFKVGGKDFSKKFEQIERIGEDRSKTKFNGRDIISFIENLKGSFLPSIDTFLEGKQEIYQEIGKILITQTLLPFEIPERILSRDSELTTNAEYPASRYSRRWYDQLWAKLFCPIENFCNNNLTIITFNYDRSLEYFLTQAFQNSYPGILGPVKNVLDFIPIIHLHGQLGQLPSGNGNGQTYGINEHFYREGNDKRIWEISKSIRIIHEEVEASEAFGRAKKAIQGAEAVHFLGFGYHELNLSRLKDGFMERHHNNQIVGGSAFGLETAEKTDIIRLFSKICQKQLKLGLGTLDVLGYLRSEVEWILK